MAWSTARPLAQSHWGRRLRTACWSWCPSSGPAAEWPFGAPAEAALTEIPEHLLKRSRASGRPGPGGRRDACSAPAEGQVEDTAAAGSAPVPAAAAATPAPAPAAAVEEARAAPPPEPATSRRPRPASASPTGPCRCWRRCRWGYVYVRPRARPPASPIRWCWARSCSVPTAPPATSGRGVSAPRSTSAVVETWPDWRDHVMWVKLGSDGWPAPTWREQQAGRWGGTMPSFGGQLTDQEIAQIVHERELAGEDVAGQPAVHRAVRGRQRRDDAGRSAGPDGAPPGLGPISQEAGVDESELGG